jgi:hypothetical protein
MDKNRIIRKRPLRRILATLFLAAAVAAGWGAIASSRAVNQAKSPNQAAALRKIAPWVTQNTANGKQAEFMVILADQADLSGAAALATKAEKGRFVRDALGTRVRRRRVRSSSGLNEHGLEHRAYYIVNAIWVKGTYQDALALAQRADVSRVEGNPQVRGIPDNEREVAAPAQPAGPDTIEPGINYTHAPDVWAEGFFGQGIVVARCGYRFSLDP